MSSEIPTRQRPDGVTAIAIFYFMQGLFVFLGSCVLLFAMFGVTLKVDDPAVIVGSAIGLGMVLFVVVAVGIGSLLVGYGLLLLKPWSRWGAIVLALFLLPGFPVFTLIGFLIIWYLFQEDAVSSLEGPEAAQ